jgi:photosystem II stability/assembly factor-like uncharacterized protein
VFIMTETLYLATQAGLVICQRENGHWRVVNRVLKDTHVTSVMAREGVILAGTTDGLQRSDDNGQHWRAMNNGLSHLHVRWLAYHPDISNLEFAGTEPAGIFVSHDGGEHWMGRTEVESLRDQHEWMLPYSPEAGCVRGFTFHGQRLYAAVEVGGVLRSDDSGETWDLTAGSDGNPDLGGPPEPYVYPDIHDLAVHPSDPDLVFAATGNGLYRSDDGGATWQSMYDCYCRGLWLDPRNPDHIICGPADAVGAIGRIEESHDGGHSWQLASKGLEVPWRRTMPERITQIGDELFTVLADGRLLAAPLATLEWQYILEDAGKVTAITEHN